MKFFENSLLTDDQRFADRWFLDEPVAAIGEPMTLEEFCYGRPYIGPPPVDVPIQYEGRRVQFNLAAFDMPVVSHTFAQLVHEIAAGCGSAFR